MRVCHVRARTKRRRSCWKSREWKSRSQNWGGMRGDSSPRFRGGTGCGARGAIFDSSFHLAHLCLGRWRLRWSSHGCVAIQFERIVNIHRHRHSRARFPALAATLLALVLYVRLSLSLSLCISFIFSMLLAVIIYFLSWYCLCMYVLCGDLRARHFSHPLLGHSGDLCGP